jgi:hypothetical protein
MPAGEFLFSCPDRNREGVFGWGKRATEFAVIGAERVVRAIEIQVVDAGRVFLQINVASGTICFLPGGRVAKRDEQGGSVVGRILEFVNLQPAEVRFHLKLKVAVAQAAPYLSGVGSQSYLLGNGISMQLDRKSQVWIDGIVRQTLEAGSVLADNRRIFARFECCVLFRSFPKYRVRRDCLKSVRSLRLRASTEESHKKNQWKDCTPEGESPFWGKLESHSVVSRIVNKPYPA